MRSNNKQRLRELDRKYEEAEYLCKRIWGEPGSKERWRAVADGFKLTMCIQRQLGLQLPGHLSMSMSTVAKVSARFRPNSI